MKNNRTELTEVNNVYDIINFIKGNTNDIDTVIKEVKRVCSDNILVKPYHEKAYILTFISKDGLKHEIICGNTYNPYPNKRCYVL